MSDCGTSRTTYAIFGFCRPPRFALAVVGGVVGS
jgi:hypothetical protein